MLYELALLGGIDISISKKGEGSYFSESNMRLKLVKAGIQQRGMILRMALHIGT